MFNQYPYLNLNDLNLDYLLNEIKSMYNDVTNFVSINAIKYADPIQWNITRQYEKNTVVIDPLTGTAFISVAAVPSGVALTRTEYWTVVFDLGSFVVRAAKNFTSRYEADTTLTATFSTTAGQWLVWGDTLYRAIVNITAGDSYVIGGNIELITIEEVKNEILQLISDNYNNIVEMIGTLDDLTTTDKDNLVHAINSLVSQLNVESQTRAANDAELLKNIEQNDVTFQRAILEKRIFNDHSIENVSGYNLQGCTIVNNTLLLSYSDGVNSTIFVKCDENFNVIQRGSAVTGLGHSNGIVYHDNEIYVAEYVGDYAGKIVVLSYSTLTVLRTIEIGMSLAWRIALNEDDMIWYVEGRDADNASIIYVLDGNFTKTGTIPTVQMTLSDMSVTDQNFVYYKGALYKLGFTQTGSYSYFDVLIWKIDIASGEIVKVNQFTTVNRTDEPESLIVANDGFYIIGGQHYIFKIKIADAVNGTSQAVQVVQNIKYIESGDDLDDYITEGHYIVNDNTVFSSLSNAPSLFNNAASVIVESNAGSLIKQTVYSLNGGIAWRYFDWSGTWRAWHYANNVAFDGVVTVAGTNYQANVGISDDGVDVEVTFPDYVHFNSVPVVVASVHYTGSNYVLAGHAHVYTKAITQTGITLRFELDDGAPENSTLSFSARWIASNALGL